jgi:LmbE family N-acetylglucosaminyl deacetylase
MEHGYAFYPVKRFVAPAPVPYIATEKQLPKNQKILMFLPHSDDGRYFGSTLHLLNGRNTLKIIVMSPGYHGVDQDISVDKKNQVRWKEALRWAKRLGLDGKQLIAFRADRTYSTRRIDLGELERLRTLIESEAPTAVFIPHLSDTSQAINYNTRAMVVESLVGWMEEMHKRDPMRLRPVIVVEYPTNHVPILPPSDKNFMIFFTDPEIIKLRKQANLEHKSQILSCFDMTEIMAEAVHAISEADTLHYLQKRRHVAEYLSGITVDPRTSRGEHFGMTQLNVKGNPPAIVEMRIDFPLSEDDEKGWNGEWKTGIK